MGLRTEMRGWQTLAPAPAKTGLLSIKNKMLLEYSHTQLYTCCWWLPVKLQNQC